MEKIINTIVIQTALTLEQESVLSILTNVEDYIHPNSLLT